MRWTQVKSWGYREWRFLKGVGFQVLGRQSVEKRWRSASKHVGTFRELEEGSNVVWFGEERQQAELEEAEVDMLSNQDGSRSWMRTLKGQHTADVFKIKPGMLWHERVKLLASLLTNLPTLFWKNLFFVFLVNVVIWFSLKVKGLTAAICIFLKSARD